MSDAFGDLILQWSKREDLAARMQVFYADLDDSVASRRAVCRNRGLCCSFGRYGHKLYVTNAELAYFVRGHIGRWRPAIVGDTCPYHVDGVCTAREHRPLGCRIFYCDPDAQGWQNAEYERRLAMLKAISKGCGLPYGYTEWLSALAAVPWEASDTASDRMEDSRPSPQGIDPIPLPVIE